MDFSLNDVQSMLADSIEKYIANDYDFDTRQAHASMPAGFDPATWQTFAQLGWTAVPFAEDDGGIGGNAVDLMIVMERLGRGLVVEPYLANVILAGGILKRVASDAQKSELLAPIINGELQATLAFVEPQAGYEISDMLTTAERTDTGWTLNGAKGLVLHGGSADLIIVPARSAGAQSDRDGITMFAVSPDIDGITIRDYETVDGQRAAEVSLSAVSLTDDARIGSSNNGYETLRQTIDDATLAVCAEAVGIMSVLTEKTIEYTRNRVQFGVPISSFQALQHRMVEMYMATEQTRSLLMWAAMSSDDGADTDAVHAIKYQVGTAGTRVGEEAVQIHGGMGVTWELDVAHYFKRLTAINLMLGSADWHLDRLSEA